MPILEDLIIKKNKDISQAIPSQQKHRSNGSNMRSAPKSGFARRDDSNSNNDSIGIDGRDDIQSPPSRASDGLKKSKRRWNKPV